MTDSTVGEILLLKEMVGIKGRVGKIKDRQTVK